MLWWFIGCYREVFGVFPIRSLNGVWKSVCWVILVLFGDFSAV